MFEVEFHSCFISGTNRIQECMGERVMATQSLQLVSWFAFCAWCVACSVCGVLRVVVSLCSDMMKMFALSLSHA